MSIDAPSNGKRWRLDNPVVDPLPKCPHLRACTIVAQVVGLGSWSRDEAESIAGITLDVVATHGLTQGAVEHATRTICGITGFPEAGIAPVVEAMLAVRADEIAPEDVLDRMSDELAPARQALLTAANPALADPPTPPPPAGPVRKRLPDTRASLTHKFEIGGHDGYATVGFYPDGAPGELFITMAKEGSTIGGLMDVIGASVSIGLQYGVPLETFVKKFTYSRFEPSGHTANPAIPIARSIPDYVFQWLGLELLGRDAGSMPSPEPDPEPEPDPIPEPDPEPEPDPVHPFDDWDMPPALM